MKTFKISNTNSTNSDMRFLSKCPQAQFSTPQKNPQSAFVRCHFCPKMSTFSQKCLQEMLVCLLTFSSVHQLDQHCVRFSA